MYPETDVLPVAISREAWDAIAIPELLTARADRFVTALGLDPAVARQVAYSESLPLFEDAVARGIAPALAARTITATIKELSREGQDTAVLLEVRDAPGGPACPPIIQVLEGVRDGALAKEAVPDVLRALIGGVPVSEAVSRFSSSLSRDDLAALVRGIVQERMDFVKERGPGAMGPLMGVVMKEIRGTVDGKLVSEVLREEIAHALGDARTGRTEKRGR
jgi:glutamyl-tRNA(Gln) amidotransferase subunit E